MSECFKRIDVSGTASTKEKARDKAQTNAESYCKKTLAECPDAYEVGRGTYTKTDGQFTYQTQYMCTLVVHVTKCTKHWESFDVILMERSKMKKDNIGPLATIRIAGNGDRLTSWISRRWIDKEGYYFVELPGKGEGDTVTIRVGPINVKVEGQKAGVKLVLARCEVPKATAKKLKKLLGFDTKQKKD